MQCMCGGTLCLNILSTLRPGRGLRGDVPSLSCKQSIEASGSQGQSSSPQHPSVVSPAAMGPLQGWEEAQCCCLRPWPGGMIANLDGKWSFMLAASLAQSVRPIKIKELPLVLLHSSAGKLCECPGTSGLGAPSLCKSDPR